MGTKVHVDSYLPGYSSMRDLNHNSDGTSWASFYGDSNLSSGQYYCSPLPSANSDSLPGANKDFLKQTILKHEVTFKNQVLELHRLYRVQKDLMDEIMRKEQHKHGITYEASSSNSLFPSQMTPDDVHRRNSSFLYTNSVCDGLPISVPDIIQSSAGSNLKGKSIRASSSPLQKSGSPKASETSESRPTKVRRMIDLELLPDEYVDIGEVEQQANKEAPDSGKNLFPTHRGNTEFQADASRSDSCPRKPLALTDLNEPLQSEEISADPSVNFFGVPKRDHLVTGPGLSRDLPWKSSLNDAVNNYQYGSEGLKGNTHHWLSSALKKDGNKDSGTSIHQTNHVAKASMSPSPVKSSHHPARIFPSQPVMEGSWPANANAGLATFNRSRSFSVQSNSEVALASQLPVYGPSSDLASSWDPSWVRPNNCTSQKSSLVQPPPFLNSASLSKSPQSSVRSNEFLGNAWHVSNHPLSNPGFTGESSTRSGFDQGFSSGLKELPAPFRKGKPNSFDLNSTGDFNLNVALPNDISSEPLANRGTKIVDSEVKQDNPVLLLPWLKPKVGASCDDDATGKILGVPIFQKLMPRKGHFDINVPCEESEDFDSSANMSEIVARESGRSSALPNIIDLNSCAVEDEILSTSPDSTELTGRAPIIDLEVPVDVESREGDSHELPLESPPRNSTDTADKERDMVALAAKAIVAISLFSRDNDRVDDTVVMPHPVEEASGSDDALAWFVNVACLSSDNTTESYPDDLRESVCIEPDDFEEMTLQLSECSAEEYFPSPPVFDIPTVEETNPGNASGRARRGPARRGRQRRDFQRDILPGLTTLARNEVTEDLQTFGGLMKATGHDWNCGNRRSGSRIVSKRGRKKSVVVPSPPPLPVAPLTVNKGEMIVDSRRLGSWGKTTRRPRRQRCPPPAVAPIALS